MRSKIIDREGLVKFCGDIRNFVGKRVVANGTFDLMHVGHVRLLERAATFGNVLIVAVNSDASVRTLGKGDDRPIVPEMERAEMLAALACVNLVTIFDEPTPLNVVHLVMPNVLVKGSDWADKEVVGRKEVESWGGRVEIVPLEPGYSTTSLIERIRRTTPSWRGKCSE
jgi:D-beta-D-heptose 7-phosphate kinase/D-beta-D-heptose 1-phosphate adenosyltransferase